MSKMFGYVELDIDFDSIEYALRLKETNVNEERTMLEYEYHSLWLKLNSDKYVYSICIDCGEERRTMYVHHVHNNGRCQKCAGVYSKRLVRGPFNIEYFKSVIESIDNGDIDELKTFSEFKYYSIDLESYSNREICVTCRECKKVRKISMCGNTTSVLHICAKCSSLIIRLPILFGEDNASYGRIYTYEERKAASIRMQDIPQHMWTGFSKAHDYPVEFNERLREHIRNKYSRKCYICGLPEIEHIYGNGMWHNLAVHHIDMDKYNTNENNLIPVCMVSPYTTF